jgi:hypothetical protein
MPLSQKDAKEESDESETKPSSILVFADARQLRPSPSSDGDIVSNATAAPAATIDARGSAALQFFLVIYISPVEICLKMLTCYVLPGL